MTIPDVINIVKNWVNKFSVHTHNGSDSLQLQPTSIKGIAVTGTVVTKIVAGTNVTISPTTGQGSVTVNASGGGGGSPGGSDTDVQFNDSSAFGGNNKFTFNKATNTLTLNDGSGGGNVGGSIITGNSSDLNIETSNSNGSSSGYINIFAGSNSDTSFNNAGGISIQAGEATGNDNAGDGSFPGNVTITAGSSSSDDTSGISGGGISLTAGDSNNNGGEVDISAGNSGGSSGRGGKIVLKSGTGNAGSSGTFPSKITLESGDSLNQGNLILQVGSYNSTQGLISLQSNPGGVNLGIGVGVTLIQSPLNLIMITNTTADPATPSGGGYLYVKSGALKYIGSSGTITTIAVA